MYQYHGFGLNIASEIEMPELYAYAFDKADVTIHLGKIPEQLEGNAVKRAFSLIGEHEYTLHVKNVSRYYAGYGNKIIVEPYQGIDDRSVRIFLQGTIMAAILYQRGTIPMHASAIERAGKLILFAGHSGAGKSTLLAHLAVKGHTIFTDDICVLQHDIANNIISGAASYPMVKLWEDAINKIGSETYDKEFKVRPNLPKYGHFFHDSFNLKTLPVSKVFILNPASSAKEINYKKLNALESFKRVERQAYRYRFATGERLRGLHFSLMASLTNTVPVIEMSRPAGFTGDIHEFSNLVETLL
ncbi:MAG: serine kinase [Sphingobacteriales bacterium]|nr:MAG: serine kinase [Sphingobacteriales bacterium]